MIDISQQRIFYTPKDGGGGGFGYKDDEIAESDIHIYRQKLQSLWVFLSIFFTFVFFLFPGFCRGFFSTVTIA